MTVPEENRPKTATTDQVASRRREDAGRDEGRPRENRTMREALEDAGISPQDTEAADEDDRP